VCAFAIGAPLGGALAVYRFPGRNTLIVIANALLGLPPVVLGLFVYLLLSRPGPLGSFGILFTPTAMVVAQSLLALPIVVALVHRTTTSLWATYGDLLLNDGATPFRSLWSLMNIGRDGMLTAFHDWCGHQRRANDRPSAARTSNQDSSILRARLARHILKAKARLAHTPAANTPIKRRPS
jgi:ABC-type tungstate transport system substrate-binding protein